MLGEPNGAQNGPSRVERSERACMWWHVERRGSWEGRAHQTAIHLAHAVWLSPTLFPRPFATLPLLSLRWPRARLLGLRRSRTRFLPPSSCSSFFRVHAHRLGPPQVQTLVRYAIAGRDSSFAVGREAS